MAYHAPWSPTSETHTSQAHHSVVQGDDTAHNLFNENVTHQMKHSVLQVDDTAHNTLNENVTYQMKHIALNASLSPAIDYCNFDDSLSYQCHAKSKTAGIPLVWNRGRQIGGGTFGTAFIVTNGKGEEAVLKMPAESADSRTKQRNCKSIGDEVQNMLTIFSGLQQTKPMWEKAHNGQLRCLDHFMGYLDLKPCTGRPHPIKPPPNMMAEPEKASFVMPKMSGDLSAFMRTLDANGLATCMPDVVRSVRKALICLHMINLAHMDLKPGNILVKWQPGYCPTEVRLADFGEVAALGSPAKYKVENAIMAANYMPEEMFAKEAEGRMAGADFIVSAKHDWCMFLLMFKDYAQAYPAMPPQGTGKWDAGWAGDCGGMGPERGIHVNLGG